MPPLTVILTIPFAEPLHVGWVMTAATVVMSRAAAGCVIITEDVLVHPLASVTVTVYVPADRCPAVQVVRLHPQQEDQ